MTTHEDICISGTLEEYLQTIYTLSKHKQNVRITDIALHMKISKPSVNRAVNTLKHNGLVMHEPYGDIILTDCGRAVGAQLCGRHNMIKKFLINVLHVNESEAENEACMIEHSISQNTVDKMKSFMEK